MSDYAKAFAAIAQEDRLAYRDHLKLPFLDGDTVVMTDGRCMLLVPTQHIADAQAYGELHHMPPWRSILRTSDHQARRVARLKLDAWLKCEPKICSWCEHCGQDWTNACRNHKPVDHIMWDDCPKGSIGTLQLNRYMAWSVLQHLGGAVSIHAGDAFDYIEFRGDEGWRFMLMPLNPDRASERGAMPGLEIGS